MAKDQKGGHSRMWSLVFFLKGGIFLWNPSNTLQFSIDRYTILNQESKSGNGSNFPERREMSLFQGTRCNPLLAHLFECCSMTFLLTLPAVEEQVLRVQKDGRRFN
jgi:hypothetical protein